MEAKMQKNLDFTKPVCSNNVNELVPVRSQIESTLIMEGNTCEFPLWQYSKYKSNLKHVRIDYSDGSYVEIDTPNGYPGINFPGYIDVLMAEGQDLLYKQSFVEMSVYDIFKKLGKDPHNGGNYKIFRKDMEKCFKLSVKTDRFRDPDTGERSYTTYFRILNQMELARRRNQTSKFYFNEIFVKSIRAGYFKQLDLDFCIELDKNNQALARFLYQHIIKRIGKDMYYIRDFNEFLNDVGLGYVNNNPLKDKRKFLKLTFFPAINTIVNARKIRNYELVDNGKNIVFYSSNAKKTIYEYRENYRKTMAQKKAVRASHEAIAKESPMIYLKQVELAKRQGTGAYFEDIYQACLKQINT